MNSKHPVEIENLSFSYSSNKIINSLSLDVKPGDFLGILGPNGSGKSTLLKNIIKFLKYHHGTIRIQNIDIHKLTQKEIAKIVSLVPQKSNCNMGLTVFEMVILGRMPHLKNRWKGFDHTDTEIVEKTLNKLDIQEFRDRNILSLSGGEFQKVMVARALVQEPEILIFDEPTSNLDINHAVEIMSLARELNINNEVTVLAVLHDLNLAAMFCSPVVFLKNGQIRYKGTPFEIFTAPIIKEIYGADIDVHYDKHGRPFVIPRVKKYERVSA